MALLTRIYYYLTLLLDWFLDCIHFISETIENNPLLREIINIFLLFGAFGILIEVLLMIFNQYQSKD